MIPVNQIAAYIADRYKKSSGVEIDEMKLHKLLYFTQRESFVQENKPLFAECFHAAQYGPVMLCIRKAFQEHNLGSLPTHQFIEEHKSIFDSVFEKFAGQESWSLSDISHGELSWRNAMEVETPTEKYPRINTADIQLDAEHLKYRQSLLAQ